MMLVVIQLSCHTYFLNVVYFLVEKQTLIGTWGHRHWSCDLISNVQKAHNMGTNLLKVVSLSPTS